MIDYIEKRYYRNRWRKKLLKEYLSYLERKGDKQETIEWNRDKLKIFGRWLSDIYSPNQPVDSEMVLAYYEYRRTSGLSESTIAGDARALSAMFRWAYSVGFINSNPCKGLKKPKHVPCQLEPFTPNELSKILMYLNSIDKKRDIAIILFLCDTGCRVTAMTNIRIYDIDFSIRSVKVADKYAKRRRISWGDRTNNALLEYIKTRKDTCEYLFISERKQEKLTRSGVYRMFKRACNGAGIHFRKPHILRSYFASWFLRIGGADLAWQLPLAMGLVDDTQLKSVYARTVMQDMVVESMQKNSPGDRIPVIPPPLSYS